MTRGNLPLDHTFAPLSAQERAGVRRSPRSNKRFDVRPIVPAPETASELSRMRHPNYGEASVIHTYRNSGGEICFHAARFEWADADGQRQKAVLPITWCELASGAFKWHFKGPGSDRPLYNEERMAAEPTRAVIFCEGEKAADAAAILFPEMIATTTLGGSNGAHLSRYSILNGRTVIISPDYDEAGRKYAAEVAALAHTAGAAAVLHLRPEILGAHVPNVEGVVPRTGNVKQGWDLADALQDGWTAPLVADFISSSAPLERFPIAANDNCASETQGGDRGRPRKAFEVDERYVYKLTAVEGEVQKTPVCSPLRILGWSRDENSHGWGLLVSVTDPDGAQHDASFPISDLGDDGAGVRKMLMDKGLRLAPYRNSKANLTEYLMTADPPERFRSVSNLGWFDKVFVLPDTVIGKTSENILYRPASAAKHAFRTAGTMGEWLRLAELAKGNSRLVVAMCAGFAAPLLKDTGDETGGLHFRGKSSTGKSTTMILASTVWGGSFNSYIVQWRATDNGLEAIAARHSDMLLCLDELSQADPRKLGDTVYMLGNGMGKVRADQSGGARSTRTWRLIFLSTGEEGFEDKMREAPGGRRMKAGQEVRVIDIPADAGAGLGVFETVHDSEGGEEFSRRIKELAKQSYGHAGPAFVARITDDPDYARDKVKKLQAAFVAQIAPNGADGQVLRVANRFGLIGAAGELAIEFGILPLDSGDAISGCERCFCDWLSQRGGMGAAEDQRSVEAVLSFLDRHGASRFDRWDEFHQHDIATDSARDRVGWKRQEKGRWEYYLTSDGFREACIGYDTKMVAKVLIESGILKPSSDGKSSKAVAVPGHRKARLYHLVPPADDGESKHEQG